MTEKKTRAAQLFEVAMGTVDPDEATRIYQELVEISMMEHGKSHEEAEAIIKENLGYQAGYYDHATRERVERLFDCEHPVFGRIAINGPPTSEEAFKLGMLLGEGKKLTLAEYRAEQVSPLI